MKRITLVMMVFILLVLAGCRKVDYTLIDQPAYLRVFNDLNYAQSMDAKDSKYPSLCMIINPVLDAGGMPTGGEVVGDFLDKRDTYAPPYPSHVGNSTSVQNPEYPGKEDVLVGPILNGFDLSSWAQVRSGKLRIMFFYRPFNTTPFFELDDRLKHDVLVDTTLTLTAKEVYTLHVLQKDFLTKQTGLLLRQENFHKLPLSDTMAYVNFYNYSAKGFWQADYSLKNQDVSLRSFKYGVKDTMNIFLTLYKGQTTPDKSPFIKNFRGNYLGTMIRNADAGSVNPYYDFPLWADTSADGIRTDIWERLEFLVQGLDISDHPYISGGLSNTYANYAAAYCLLNGKVQIGGSSPLGSGVPLPNLLVSLHSGIDNPRTFATVSTIEIVNSHIYLTTIQRKYPGPVYR